MTRHRPLQIEHALQVLPDVDELGPLREALLGESRPDESSEWAGSRAWLTLDKRVVDPARLEQDIPALAERVRQRSEEIFRRVAAALRALEQGEVAEAARELIAAGEAEEGARRLEQATRYYEKALELGRRPRDRRAEGLALRRLGRVARARGDLPAALRLYRDGFDVAMAQRDLEGAVVGCQGMGNVLGEMGHWEDARQWFEQGLALVEHRPASALHWQLFNNLSIVEGRAGRLDLAQQWLDRAANVVAELGDRTGQVFVANASGRLHLFRGAFVEAEAAFREALDHASDPLHRVTVLVNLAEALVGQKRLREAEEAARRAEESALGYGLSTKLPDVYRVLGAVARARQDAEGFLFFEQALEACAEFHLPEVEVAVIQHQYALFELEHGQPAAAEARLRQAIETFALLGTSRELALAQADLARVERVDGSTVPETN